MDKKLQLIRHLYGETEDHGDLRELLEEPGLKAEHQALSEVKFWLDHAKRERPDSAVLDAIRDAAAQDVKAPSPSPLTVREDRAPIARPSTLRRRFGAIASVLSLLVAVGVGYQFFGPAAGGLEPAVQRLDATEEKEMAAAPAPAERREAFMESDDADLSAEEAEPALADEIRSLGASAPAAPSVASLSMSSDTTVPEWDDVDDLRLYKRRIEMLLEQSEDLSWEQSVPLEMLPAGRAPDGALRQARSRTPSSNQ